MTLTVDNAAQAGVLADQIKERRQLITTIQQALSEAWPLARLVAVRPHETEVPLLIDRLNQADTAAVLNALVGVVQGQIGALEAQLAAVAG